MRTSPLALAALCLSACNGDAPDRVQDENEAAAPRIVQDRFIVRRSAYAPPVTLSRLLEALDRRELTVFAVIDHSAAAESVDAELPFSTLVVFGNPDAGTQLIRAVPLMGAELPMRALVYQVGDETRLAMTGVPNLVRSYPLRDVEPVPTRMSALVEDVAKEVTGR